MKKAIILITVLLLQTTLTWATTIQAPTTSGISTLHFGYLESGSFVVGDHLYNSELRPIPSDAGAFQIQGNAQGTIQNPIQLFLGIAFADSSFQLPSITKILTTSNTTVLVPSVESIYKARLDASTADAYSLLGLGFINNSQNWTNWSGAYSKLIAPMPNDGFFGIFEYDLSDTGFTDNKHPLGVEFEGDLPAGTFMFGAVKYKDDKGNINYYGTPFTETGMTPPPVPEPGTIVLLGAGFLGLAAYGRKKIKK